MEEDTISRYISFVDAAIEKSGNFDSNIVSGDLIINDESKTELLGVISMDEPAYLHLLNNLTFFGSVVTHVGFWYGASLFSQLIGTFPARVNAIDLHFENSNLRKTFIENSQRLDLINKFVFFSEDCFSVDLSKLFSPVDLHIYDADHTPEAQYNGIYYFGPTFNDIYIVVIDNFAYEGAEKASDKAFEDLGHVVRKKWIIERHCHQGLYVVTKE